MIFSSCRSFEKWCFVPFLDIILFFFARHYSSQLLLNSALDSKKMVGFCVFIITILANITSAKISLRTQGIIVHYSLKSYFTLTLSLRIYILLLLLIIEPRYLLYYFFVGLWFLSGMIFFTSQKLFQVNERGCIIYFIIKDHSRITLKDRKTKFNSCGEAINRNS